MYADCKSSIVTLRIEYFITYDNLTLSEVIGRFFLPRYPSGSETLFYINDTFYISCSNYVSPYLPRFSLVILSPYDLYRMLRHPYRFARAYIGLGRSPADSDIRI